MIRAFESLLKLDNIWIEWIAEYVLPQLTKLQLDIIKKYWLNNINNKQWNKLIKKWNLKTIISFNKYNIWNKLNTQQMQNIILKYYRNDELIQFLIGAEYDIIKVFGTNQILYTILNDNSMENIQFDNIINTIHFRIQKLIIHNEINRAAAMIVINEIIINCEWKINSTI